MLSLEQRAKVERILSGDSECEFLGDGRLDDASGQRMLFPGSFNPLHAGHGQMVQHAVRHFGGEVEFEISILNVDKPGLNRTEIEQRLLQFRMPDNETSPVWLTRAPTFREKARLFPGCLFLVGADTLVRVGDLGYYESAQKFGQTIQEIQELGCRFVVFGRLVGNLFLTRKTARIPTTLLEITIEIPGLEFRNDISSSKLRNIE